MRPQFAGGAVEDRIDEFMSVGRAELLRELHRLAERDAVRQFVARLQFVHAEPQYRVLDRIEVVRRNLAEARDRGVERLALRRDRRDQFAEILAVDTLGFGVVQKIVVRILPRARIDLQPIERLQREPARKAPGAALARG